MMTFDREKFMAHINLPDGAREVIRSADIPAQELRSWKSLFDTDEELFFKSLEQRPDHFVWSLRFFVAIAGETYKRYQEHQMKEDIFFDSLSDISLWCIECFRQHGVYGLAEVRWIAKSLNLKLFRLGRLQFEPQVLQNVLAGEEYSFPKGTEYLYVHIPAGGSLLHEACLYSFQWADSFFNSKYKFFFCKSWLLSPVLKEILPPESNILRFQEFF